VSEHIGWLGWSCRHQYVRMRSPSGRHIQLMPVASRNMRTAPLTAIVGAARKSQLLVILAPSIVVGTGSGLRSRFSALTSGSSQVHGAPGHADGFTGRCHTSSELRICGWRLNFAPYSPGLCELTLAEHERRRRPAHSAATARRLRPEAARAEKPTANWQPKGLRTRNGGQLPGPLEAGGAVPQTAAIRVVTWRCTFRQLNFAPYSSEDRRRRIDR
jgi:hypothetical protein